MDIPHTCIAILFGQKIYNKSFDKFGFINIIVRQDLHLSRIYALRAVGSTHGSSRGFYKIRHVVSGVRFFRYNFYSLWHLRKTVAIDSMIRAVMCTDKVV